MHHFLSRVHQLLSVQPDGPGDDASRVRQDLKDGVGGDGFAGTGFAHDAQGAAPVQIEGQSVDGPYFTGVGEEGGVKIFYG